MRLEVRNLIKTYTIKNQDPVKALDDVSLLFPETGLVFILGKSGSGKSTLLNVMGGLDSLDSGEIIINDRSSKSFSGSEMDSYRNTYLGFIFQEYNILNDFNIHDNVALAIELQNRKADEATINAILEEVDLKGFAKRKPNEMSGGQKQRVAIARALVKDPKIIFADEPTGALDSNTGKAVFETLRKLSKTRLVVCVSHDRDFAEHFGDRVIEMKDGKVISDISKRDVVPESAANGISLIGDNVIRFAPGRELTAADLPILNAALKKSDGQAFLSVDKHVNETICESARISADGSRQEFFDTKKDDVKAGSGKFKAIKSRFPMKDAFRMGSKSLSVKPVRLTLTILLSFTAFALFGLTATMAGVNAVNVEANTLHDAGTKLLNVKRYSNGRGFSDATIREAEKEFGTTVHPYVYFNNTENYSYGKDRINHISNPYYLSDINQAVVLDDSLKSTLGYHLIGEQPVEKDEIVVTDWYALAFKDFGYYKNQNEFVEPNTFTASDLIGMNVGNYKITGVFETDIENKLADYSSFKGKYNFDDYNFYGQLQNITAEAKAGFAFMSEEGMKEYIANNGNSNYSSDYTFSYREYRENCVFADYQKVDKAFYFDKNQTALAEDEILIPENIISNIIDIASLPRIINNPIDLDNIPHTEEGRVVIGEFQAMYGFEETVGDIAMRKLAGDKYRTFPYDYPEIFKEVARDQDNFDLYWNESDQKFYTYNQVSGEYDTEFKPFDIMTEGQIFNYLYLFLAQNVDRSGFNFSTGERLNLNDEEYAKLPYSSLYQTYYQNAYDYAFEVYSLQGYGLSMYDRARSNLESKTHQEYCTATRAKAWWNATKNTAGSFASQYLVMLISNNPDFSESRMGDWEYINAFESFLNSCVEKRNMVTGASNYSPLAVEEAYYQAYLEALNAKMAKIAKYIEGAAPITLDIRKPSTDQDNEKGQLKIVGIAHSLSSYTRYNRTFYASMDTIGKYVPSENLDVGPYSGLLVETPNARTIRSVVEACDKSMKEYYKNDYNGKYWSIEEPNYSAIASIMSVIETMMKVFFYIGLFFLAFSMLLFYTFISASISNKRREIGILRAVGARGSDVFKVFYSESFIIAIINFVLAGIATVIVSLVLNNYFASELGFPITLLKPGFIELGLVLAAALLASFISALLPVLRIAHQKPIDAIRGK